VAGSRKATELRKIARAGRAPLLNFMEVAFGRPLRYPLAADPAAGVAPPAEGAFDAADDAAADAAYADDDGDDAAAGAAAAVRRARRPLDGVLAPSLFGGADHEGGRLAQPLGFDAAAMRAAAAALPLDIPPESSLGATLAAALFSCAPPPAVAADAADVAAAAAAAATAVVDADAADVPRRAILAARARASEVGAVEGDAAAAAAAGAAGGGAAAAAAAAEAARLDAAAAAAAAHAREEAGKACDGLCASNEMRQAAQTPLRCVEQLLEPPPPTHAEHAAFADAAGVPAAEFASHARTWELLRRGVGEGSCGSSGAVTLPPSAEFVLALCRTRCAPATAAALDARLAALRADGPPISGGCIPASAPAHRRGALIASLHVLCRLRGEPAPLETSEQLEELSERCGGLLGALHDAWYDGDGALRPEFAKPKKGKAAGDV